MTFGTYQGQPVAAVPTWYLLWFVSQESMRYKHWPLIEDALQELRDRLRQWDAVVAELRVTDAPQRHNTAKRANAKKAERAEKLRELEERRRRAFQEETRKRVAWNLARRYRVPSGTMTADQILEAFEAGTLPGQVKPGVTKVDSSFDGLV